MNIGIYIKIFLSIFTIMGPFIAIPTFISLTPNIDKEATKLIARRATIVAFFILLVSTFIGAELFNVLGISLSSFRIAGGVLIFLMGLNMLHAKKTNVKVTAAEIEEALDQEDISIFPLATPMIAGPGAISTVILFASGTGHSGLTHMQMLLSVIFSVLISCFLLYLLLKYSKILYNKLGRTGLNIITRIMGLVIAANGVEFIIIGVRNSFNI